MYRYEVKWDGIRVLILIDESNIQILSRSGRDLTSKFPELIESRSRLNVASAIYDAEIVSLDHSGRPIFKKVIGRMHQSNQSKIESLSKSKPVVCYLFDCLYMDGRSLINEPWFRRHEWMLDSIKKNMLFRGSEAIEDGKALYDAAKKMKLEGIMAKHITGTYHPGRRTRDWLKIKFRDTTDCIIIGYTIGQGERSRLFGALHIIEKFNNEVIYRGKVGTGFDQDKMEEILQTIQPHITEQKPILQKTENDLDSIWCAPRILCEIEYASITENQTFREPVFIRLRPDLENEPG